MRKRQPGPRSLASSVKVRNEILVFTLIGLGMLNVLIIVLGMSTYEAAQTVQHFGAITSIEPINLSEATADPISLQKRKLTSSRKRVLKRFKRLPDDVPPVRSGCIIVVGYEEPFDPLRFGPPPPLPSFVPTEMPDVLPDELPPGPTVRRILKAVILSTPTHHPQKDHRKQQTTMSDALESPLQSRVSKVSQRR